MAEILSEQDIEDIAAFYATQSISIEVGEINRLGEKIYKSGNTETGVPACAACHGPGGSGNPQAHFPLIHGQYAAYVSKVLNDFKSGERGNDESGIMRSAAARLNEAEIEAVAEYVSTLQPFNGR
jgi:cytochrome c553